VAGIRKQPVSIFDARHKPLARISELPKTRFRTGASIVYGNQWTNPFGTKFHLLDRVVRGAFSSFVRTEWELFVDSYFCLLIARCLLFTPARNDRWRIPFALLIGAMLAIGAFAIVMVVLGDSWFDRRSYFLNPDRFGRKFARATIGTLAFGLALCWSLPKASLSRFWLLLGFL
jgi:hypothetical protein